MTEELQERMYNFLAGNWNQSMDSPEGALEEFLARCSKESLIDKIELLGSFLGSIESDEWKTTFIEKNTDIYWPNMEESPLAWLIHVKARLEEAVREM